MMTLTVSAEDNLKWRRKNVNKYKIDQKGLENKHHQKYKINTDEYKVQVSNYLTYLKLE